MSNLQKMFIAITLLIATNLWAGEIIQTVEFSPDDLVFSKVQNYDVVELRGCVAMASQPGEPRLPKLMQSVLIPAGAVPVGVEVVSEEVIELNGNYKIYPYQPDVPLPMPGRVFVPEFFEPKAEIYNSAALFPLKRCNLTGSGTLSGYRIAHIEINPVQYIPAQGKLKFARKIIYKLRYVENRVDNTVPTIDQQRIFGEDVRAVVVNPEMVEVFAPVVSGRGVSRFLPPGNYKYVIVSGATYLDSIFQRLAKWKTKKGIPAKVVPISWINSNYSGWDLPEKIRNFIIDAKNTWGTIWVLLGGSADHKTGGQNLLPERSCWYTFSYAYYYYDEDTIPCDLYFAGLDGTWDYNNDHTYGQISDSADMYSDVYVGRASVYTIAKAQNFVSKILTYEKNPPTNYIRKMLLPTAILWSSYEERPMQDSIAKMTPSPWIDAKLYERNGTLSRQRMIDSMNVGYGMGAWEGHGNENGIYMSGVPYLNSNDADGLVNGNKQGIAISIACFTGAWDETPGGDCFAEHLINRTGGGLIGVMFNSRYGWGAIVGGQYVPGPSERLDTTYFAKIFHTGLYKMGQVLAVDKDCWVPYADAGAQYTFTRWCLYELNLLGDPELSLWTDVPTAMQVSYNTMVPIGINNFEVTVKESNGVTPVESAFVCLMGKTDTLLYGTCFTNSSGIATVNINASIPQDTVWVTVTKKNRLPYEGFAIVVDLGMPVMPTVIKPLDFACLPNLQPTLSFVSNDPNNDQLQYRVLWDTDPNFATPDSATTGLYNSGVVVNFVFPSQLVQGTTYWWKVKCKDPAGSGYWTSYTTKRSFTVNTNLPTCTCSWFQTTNAQFNFDILNGTIVQGDSVVLIAMDQTIIDTLLFADFENGIPWGWTVVDGNFDGVKWSAGTTYDIWDYAPPNYGSSYAYYSDDDAGYMIVNNNEELISPKVYVGNINFGKLEFVYGYGFLAYQTGEKFRVKFRKKVGGGWTSWINLAEYTVSISGTEILDLTSHLPCDSMQFEWFYSDSTSLYHWGYACACDNILLRWVYQWSDYGTLTSTPVNYHDLSTTYPRNRWGNVVWRKSSGGDSIGIQVEYWNGSGWQLVPNSVLPGNSTGFFTHLAVDSVRLTNVDTVNYNTLRLKALFYRKAKSPNNPALLDWEVGNLSSGIGIEETENSKSEILNPSLEVYPNPFRNATGIKFQIPIQKVVSSQYSVVSNNGVASSQKSVVSIKIYDATGRLVKSFSLTTDYCVLGTIVWDGTDDLGRRLPSGIYFVRLATDAFKQIEKAILLR